jgi:hypothetical protein
MLRERNEMIGQKYGDRNTVLRAWALSQIMPWLAKPVPPAGIGAAMEHLNATNPNVFLLSVSDAAAQVVEKPVSARHAHYGLAFTRAHSYRMWLETVAREALPGLRTILAVCVGDGALGNPSIPVFSFQKPTGNRCLLLPDVDLLSFPAITDRLSYHEKQCRAVFIGATSGGFLPSEGVRRDGGIPRVRSAVFFRGKPQVRFELRKIVQVDSEETADLLRNMGFGDDRYISWDEQLESRFLLSMDGNGAACSRVLVALASNSVLVPGIRVE